MALDTEQSEVLISHRPNHSIGFDEMGTTFDVIASVDLNTFAVGERVHCFAEASTRRKRQNCVGVPVGKR